MTVFGIHLEAIKMCPVIKELKSRPDVKTIVTVIGQYKEMLEQVLETFGVILDYYINNCYEKTLGDVKDNSQCD